MASNIHNEDVDAFTKRMREIGRPKPIYTPGNSYSTHSIHYDWSGWLSKNAPFPRSTLSAIESSKLLWEKDQLQLTEKALSGDSLQLCFCAPPTISPVAFASQVKGRLQHALRLAGTPVEFSRKVSVRTLGENIRHTVERYLQKQVKKEGFVDPQFIKRMSKYTNEYHEVDLSQPASTNSGRYWYNLHLVFVISGRVRIYDDKFLSDIRDSTVSIATAKQFQLKSLAVMPDHLHIALRGIPSMTPEEIALSLMSNLAYLLGQNRVLEYKYYVGTFSEYDLNTIRN